MRDICSHVLDLVQNALTAAASLIQVGVYVDWKRDELGLSVRDNGQGMSEQTVRAIGDPFVVGTGEHISLGLALLDASTKRAGGTLKVCSARAQGTTVAFTYQLSHVDRPPLGDLGRCIYLVLACNSSVDFILESRMTQVEPAILDTREIKRALGAHRALGEPTFAQWLLDAVNSMYPPLPEDAE